MAKRRPGRSKVRRTAPAKAPKRTVSVRAFLIGLGAVLVLIAIAVVLIRRKDAPSIPSAPPVVTESMPQIATAPEPFRFNVDLDDASLSAGQKDRSLRDEQIQVVERLVAMMPSNANAVFLLGMVHQEQGDTVAATQALQRCLELAPNRADAYDHLGRIAQQQDEPEKAATCFEKALALNPKMAGLHYRLGQVYRACNRPDEAIAAVTRSVAQAPQAPENHVLLGELHLQKQRYEEAQRHYEAALVRDPNLSKPYYGLATAAARLGRREQALEYRRKFKEVEEKEREIAKQQRTDFDPLQVTCGSAAHTHTDVARVLAIGGHLTLAEQLWRRAARLDSANVDCRFSMADRYFRMKRFQQALPWYLEVIEAAPNHGPAHFFLAHVYEELDQDAKARQAYEKVIRVSPGRPEGFLALARFLWERDGDLQRAKGLVQRAVDLAPIAANYAFLGRVCHKSGDREAARAAVQKAVQLAPRHPEYQRLLRQVQEN